MKKGGGSESTIIVGPSKSVLVYALHSLEYVLGLARFRVFVPNLKMNMITLLRNLRSPSPIFVDRTGNIYPLIQLFNNFSKNSYERKVISSNRVNVQALNSEKDSVIVKKLKQIFIHTNLREQNNSFLTSKN